MYSRPESKKEAGRGRVCMGARKWTRTEKHTKQLRSHTKLEEKGKNKKKKKMEKKDFKKLRKKAAQVSKKKGSNKNSLVSGEKRESGKGKKEKKIWKGGGRGGSKAIRKESNSFKKGGGKSYARCNAEGKRRC